MVDSVSCLLQFLSQPFASGNRSDPKLPFGHIHPDIQRVHSLQFHTFYTVNYQNFDVSRSPEGAREAIRNIQIVIHQSYSTTLFKTMFLLPYFPGEISGFLQFNSLSLSGTPGIRTRGYLFAIKFMASTATLLIIKDSTQDII